MGNVNKEFKPPSGRIVKQKPKKTLRKREFTFRKKLDNPVLKKLAIAFVIVIAAVCLYVHYLAPHTLEARQRVKLESTQQQLLQTKELLEQQKTIDAKQDAKKQKQLEDIQKKLKDTQKQLQAKRDLPESTHAYAMAAPQSHISGNKQSWLAASGIPESDWWAVDYIVSHESGWNPNAVNAFSGACGLAQQLPCGKWAGDWNDPVAALKAQYKYVTNRYGGYAQAVSYWKTHGNY